MTTLSPTANQSPPRILFVDDEQPILNSLQRFARANRWQAFAAESGDSALAQLAENSVDVVVSDMRMAGMDGATFLTEVKKRWPNTIRILLTGYSDIDALEQAINDAAIFNYVTKPWDESLLIQVIERGIQYQHSEAERLRLEKLTRRQNRELKDLNNQLEARVKERTIEVEQALTLLQGMHKQTTNKFLDSIKVLTQIMDWKEGRDSGHNWFVVDYAERLALACNQTDEALENTRIAAALHRIGMLALPDALREKTRYELTQEEKALYRQIPEWGEMALSNASGLQEVANIVRHQCEWVNGKGYPDELAMHNIPLASKIIHLVSEFFDVYNGRVEAGISGIEGARNYVRQWSGKTFDAQLVKTFLELVSDFQDVSYQSLRLGCDDLREGMVLERDIVSSNGMLLLAAGSVLSAKKIETLRSYEKSLQESFDILICTENSEQENGQ